MVIIPTMSESEMGNPQRTPTPALCYCSVQTGRHSDSDGEAFND